MHDHMKVNFHREDLMCTYHLMGEETGERLGSTEKRRWWARPSARREGGREFN
jgi:hypothetical protein